MFFYSLPIWESTKKNPEYYGCFLKKAKRGESKRISSKAYCLLLTAYCLLLTAYCLSLTTYHLPLTTETTSQNPDNWTDERLKILNWDKHLQKPREV